MVSLTLPSLLKILAVEFYLLSRDLSKEVLVFKFLLETTIRQAL